MLSFDAEVGVGVVVGGVDSGNVFDGWNAVDLADVLPADDELVLVLAADVVRVALPGDVQVVGVGVVVDDVVVQHVLVSDAALSLVQGVDAVLVVVCVFGAELGGAAGVG